MLNGFTRPVLLVRGLVCMILGVLLIALPLGTLEILMQILGIVLVINGIGGFFADVDNLQVKSPAGWLYPILTVILGVFAFFAPLALGLGVFWVIAAWFLVSGLTQAGLLFLPYAGSSKLLMGMSAIINIILGLLFISHPFSGLAAMVWLAGVFLSAGGLLTIIIGCCLKVVRIQD